MLFRFEVKNETKETASKPPRKPSDTFAHQITVEAFQLVYLLTLFSLLYNFINKKTKCDSEEFNPEALQDYQRRVRMLKSEVLAFPAEKISKGMSSSTVASQALDLILFFLSMRNQKIINTSQLPALVPSVMLSLTRLPHRGHRAKNAREAMHGMHEVSEELYCLEARVPRSLW